MPDEALEAFVVFTPTIWPKWWNLFTGPEYAHCWLMMARYYPAPSLTALRWTAKLEATRTGIHADVWWEDPDVIAKAFAPKVTEILRVNRRVRHDRMIYRGIMNCVTVTKAALGVEAPLVLTPGQLRDYLVHEMDATTLEG